MKDKRYRFNREEKASVTDLLVKRQHQIIGLRRLLLCVKYERDELLAQLEEAREKLEDSQSDELEDRNPDPDVLEQINAAIEEVVLSCPEPTCQGRALESPVRCDRCRRLYEIYGIGEECC